MSFSKVCYFFLLALFILLVACDHELGKGFVTDFPLNEDVDHEGFVLVEATGSSTTLGTDSKSAKANERPAMEVAFDYDFSIAKHEVTCGEFYELMSIAPCANDSVPITDVNYYEAVLYANARSKAEGLDTVYSFTNVNYDADRRCVGLDGLTFHPEVTGYRLPTEAEWVLVASAGWNTRIGWTASNSENQLHPVCEKKSRSSGICDMVGNAMEWVNDWAGSFRDTSVTNYVGAPDGGSLGERIVKGGSYINEASTISLYGRGDVYTVASATHAEYVGFRLAIGAIPNPVWLGKDGAAVVNPVVSLVNASSMRSIAGTSKVKMAFRNDENGRLTYIDYANAALSAVEIPDTLDVYHPEISPDGKRVAFCTGVEGINGKSSVYVRNLDESGSGLVKLDVESAVLPRWRILDTGDTVIVYVTDAGNNKSDADFFGNSTWQVSFADGKFGTPQKLFDGNYHGGISEDSRLAVTGARLLRARIASAGGNLQTDARDTVWYNGEQACNASLSSDGSKRTLFLDFGGDTGKEFVGKDYDVHERLLIADSTGRLIQSVASPDGFAFDHSEWARGSENFAVSTLTNVDGAHKKIALVNLKDSSVTDLVSGEELWHPSLWMKSIARVDSSGWDSDSVGFYYAEGQSEQGLLAQKMPMFWKYRNMARLVALGSSRVWSGVYADSLSVNAVNMGITPCDMHCIYFMQKNYVMNHYRKLKYLVVSLDFDLWSNNDENATIGENMVGGISFVYDANHDYWAGGVDSTFVNKVLDEASEKALQWENTLGWYASKFSQGWYNALGQAEVLGDSTWSDDELSLNGNLEKLRSVIELAANYDVKVLGVVFPQSPGYKSTGAFGRHGMRRSDAETMIQRVQDLELEYTNFLVLDENAMGDHDYNDAMAQDYDHLNYIGALKLTRQIEYKLKWFE